MSGPKAGPVLDAEIAERVMGESLIVPRERAMAIVGASYVRVTGPTFKLDVHGYELSVDMPNWQTLAEHPSDENYNHRYFRHAVAELLKYPNEIAAFVAQDVAACRKAAAKPYSTDIAAAFLVVEKMREHPLFFELREAGRIGDHGMATHDTDYCARFVSTLHPCGFESGKTPAHAICLAALDAIERLTAVAALSEGQPHG